MYASGYNFTDAKLYLESAKPQHKVNYLSAGFKKIMQLVG